MLTLTLTLDFASACASSLSMHPLGMFSAKTRRVLKPRLTKQVKFKDLLRQDDVYEASDCVVRNGEVYTVFDNTYRVAKCNVSLNAIQATLLVKADMEDGESQYEFIGYSEELNRLVLGMEMDANKRAESVNAIALGPTSYTVNRRYPFDLFKFPEVNLGFEGIMVIDALYFMICEGFACGPGSSSRDRGRIAVFRRSGVAMRYVKTMLIPPSLGFKDFASLGYRNGKVLVLSQESAAFAILDIDLDALELDDSDLTIVEFPKDYCNLEGADWIGGNRFVLVTDKTKKNQKSECVKNSQSILTIVVDGL